MSRDLLEQLAEYGDHVRAAERAITLAEVAGDLTGPTVSAVVDLLHGVDGKEITMVDTPTTAQRPTMTRSHWMLSAAAAAVLAIAVGGIVVLRTDDDEPADELTSTSTDLPTTVSPPPSTVEQTPTTVEPTPTTVGTVPTAQIPVVPTDALGEPAEGEVGATSETPLPVFDDAELADSGEPPRASSSVDDLPDSARLDFLAEFCDDRGCFRDAQFRDGNGDPLGGAWAAGEPFHIRHGFVNDGPGELGEGFDLAVYAFPMPFGGGTRAASGPTRRYTTDSVVRAETDACGPNYQDQTGTVTCEWFVHDFPNGLTEGRWALWAVWEAPCSAWIDLGHTDACSDPDEVMSFFSSGVDSPFDAPSIADGDEPVITEVGDWTRVDGSDVFGLVSDGAAFFTSDGFSLLRSDDGSTWEEYAEFGEPIVQLEELVGQFGSQFEGGPPAALHDGRFVAVEDLRADSVIVHVVDPDGTRSTQVVPVEIPAPYEPFHRELKPGVHLLDDGRIVVTASYSADAGLVEATGRTRAELGLDLFYPMQRPIVVVSVDGETWTQQPTPPESIRFAATAAGGLVAHTGPIHAGHADRVVSFSTDGVTWEPVVDPDTGAPMQGGGPFVAVDNRAFLMRAPSRIWEIANGEARLIAGPGAAQEPLELFERFHSGRLAAGDAGLAYVVAIDESKRDPLPDGPGIRYSLDDGATWEFEPFPAELATGHPGELAVGATQIVLVHHGDGDGPSLWVRDFPG